MTHQTMFDILCSEKHLLSAWKDIKNKGSSGGVDGQNISDFEKDLGNNLLEIAESLRRGKWSPMPYMQIEIPKKVTEKRRLGLLTIKDKIVQQAIKALIDARVCQALLSAQLNPYDSVIHVRQSGKPTFSYDFIELFRSQAVDRVVISMLQKGEQVQIKDGLLTDDRRRYRVVKALKQYGTAINMSVYECMLTDSQFEKLRIRLGKLIDVESDKIVYYHICLDCFTKITYQPEKIRRDTNIITVI